MPSGVLSRTITVCTANDSANANRSMPCGSASAIVPLGYGEHVYWFWIGPHAEYDELLKRFNNIGDNVSSLF